MRQYLICYWVERNDVATDLEDIIEAETIIEALEKFTATKVFRKINSISEITNPYYDKNV